LLQENTEAKVGEDEEPNDEWDRETEEPDNRHEGRNAREGSGSGDETLEVMK
jgi:hypothetical protein